MLRTLSILSGYKVSATDGEIGTVSDFYFDDQRWTIRYLVVDTGSFWRGPHRGLISPISFRHVDWSTRHFHLALTRDKVKNSPAADLDRPVSRQYEESYHRYYGWAPYWGFGGSWDWGPGIFPRALADSTWKAAPAGAHHASDDPHLRSTQVVTGYEVHGDHEILGHIAELIVDDETWAIRYLVVDTHKWWSGKKVLVSPRWAHDISWSEQTIHMDLSRETLKKSPAWNPDGPVNREYEARLYDYYGRPVYWLDADGNRDEKHPPV